MKKQPGKKLTLNRETVRKLTTRELEQAGGGFYLTLGQLSVACATQYCSIITNHNETLLRARRTA